MQGFACGWLYIFGYMIDFANKAVAFSQYVTYWTGPSDQLANSVLEITFFFIPPILLNFLNVRFYGEVEFGLTATKVQVILVIIIVGIVIAAGGGPAQLLGTDSSTYDIVQCNSTLEQNGNCTTGPGFQRMYQLRLITDRKSLGRSANPCCVDAGWLGWKAFATLGLLLLGSLFVLWKRGNRHHLRGNREAT